MARYKKRKGSKKVQSDAERARKYRAVKKTIQNAEREVESEYSSDENNKMNLNIQKNSTKELLRNWAMCHGITARAINELLKILILAGW